MGAGSGRAGSLHAGPAQPGTMSAASAASQEARARRWGRPGWLRARWARWLEALGVAASPALAALVLRLRLMAPSVLPDPAIHSMYIVDPRDVFTRYAAAYASTARLREGARVGFLVPARLAYLAFGAVPGFFVTRYVFALIAVVPVYLLLRRLYGRGAGVAGVVVVLSSPVIVTAWGTDYPDSAVVSYALGAMACLVMPCAPRWRRGWLAGAGVLMTLAAWAHGVAVPLVGAALAAWLAVRLVRERAGLAGDLAVLAGAAAVVTGLLVAGSAVLLGHANFIALTWQALRYLSTPSQTVLWHSANWRWAPYVAYLLVPPAVLGGYLAAVAGRRGLRPEVLMIGAMAATQLAVYTVLQFAATVQTLEQHYFSSTLWAGVCLVLAVTVAELARSLPGHPLAGWLPAVVLAAVPLAYEADPHVPAFGWLPFGAIVAGVVVAAAVAARACARIGRAVIAVAATGLALVAFAGAALVLTVAPIPSHPRLSQTVVDRAPAYASALGGSGAIYIDSYRIGTALPGFVGQASYPGEQLLFWRLTQEPLPDLMYAAGMYHDGFNQLRFHEPVLVGRDRSKLESRRPAELLLFADTAAPFPAAVRALAAFRPSVVRTGVLRAGPEVLHAWLLRLGVYYHPPAHTR